MKNLKPFIVIGINKNKKFEIKISIINLILAILVFTAFSLSFILVNKFFALRKEQDLRNAQVVRTKHLEILQAKVIKDKYVFNIDWGDLGKRMSEDGVIDKTKLAQAVTGKDELPKDLEKYFSDDEKQIKLTMENSRFWVDVLWGLGLANSSKVLEEGPMVESGDPSGFASTGGWSLGVSEAMNYYSKYSYLNLTDKQQDRVKKIAENIYRPCCGNSTAFPDCNHGMAALGLIELMVSQDKSEEDIYKTVLAFNSYWFPDTYLSIAYYFDKTGKDYEKISAKELLSKTFSSAMGAQKVSKEIEEVSWPALQRGGSCGA